VKWIRHRRAGPGRDGCGFLLLTCLFTCFLLALNCAAVGRFYPELVSNAPEFLREGRIPQMTMFIAPVVLTFVEWWLVDWIVELVSSRPRP
jgi:hypothetical protein